jgi:WD40 repeat protein
VAIDPRGHWIAAGGDVASSVHIWPLVGEPGTEGRTLDVGAPLASALRVSPRGDYLIAGTMAGVRLIPLDGRPPERLAGFEALVAGVALDATGTLVAAGGGVQGELASRGETVIRVWNLDTGEVTVLDAGDGQPIPNVEFTPEGRLLAAGPGGVRVWDLGTRTSTRLMEGRIARAVPSADGRYILVLRAEMRPGGAVGSAVVYDAQSRRSWDLTSHGSEITSVAWTASQQVVTASRDGIVRVGRVTGEEPHLLMGHEAPGRGLAVQTGDRWIASTGDDGTVRMWPMPEGQPFHTLPLDELLNRLRAVTNYRVIEDAAAPGGYRLDFEPFKGWKGPPPRW